MRPVSFCILLILLNPFRLPAQDPVTAGFRTFEWPAASVNDGFGWSVFSRQYYCISNWNATGFSAVYSFGNSRSAATVRRDGLPGYSWYHLYLSHYRQFRAFSAMLQLRFTWISLGDHPPVLRLGGDIIAGLPLSRSTGIQVRIFDIPGWVLPGMAVTRGDPSMHLTIFHEPGRMIGLAGGFRMNRQTLGPVYAGVRMSINDQIDLTMLVDLLPAGVSFGINWNIHGYKCTGWLEQKSGTGLTPMLEISGEFGK